MNRKLRLLKETWPLTARFAISRGSRTSSETLTAEIEQEGQVGRGECAPYSRYGESIDGVMAAIEGLRGRIESGLGREELQRLLPAGAARNAIDCALWDLEAKLTGKPVWQLAGLPQPKPILTAYTISLDTPEKMGASARTQASRPLLKLKLTGLADLERVRAVHDNAPKARLIVDANEAWTPANFTDLAPKLKFLGVELIEQPFPQASDRPLENLARPITVCADESCHDRASLAQIAGRYDAVNIKLDKTGGLTEALALKEASRGAGYKVMVGCMLGTSLATAPALLVAEGAEIVDLDSPLFLARDRTPGLHYTGSQVAPADRSLWG